MLLSLRLPPISRAHLATANVRLFDIDEAAASCGGDRDARLVEVFMPAGGRNVVVTGDTAVNAAGALLVPPVVGSRRAGTMAVGDVAGGGDGRPVRS